MGKNHDPIQHQCNEGRDRVMKEKLDSESRAAIVNYRLERAYETLKEADYNTMQPLTVFIMLAIILLLHCC